MLLLFFLLNISTTRAWLNATRPAPKKPWKALNNNKYSIVGERPQRLEKIVKPSTPKVYIFFLPKYLHKKPKLIIPMPDEIENTVITQDVTEFVIEKLLSIFINAIETIPKSNVNKLVARHIKNKLVILFVFFN